MIFFPCEFKNKIFSFNSDDTKHIKNVLRAKSSQVINCIYNEKQYKARIINLNPLQAEAICEEQITTIKNYSQEIFLFQAIIKQKNFEWLTMKATELQVDKIYPILFHRSQKDRLCDSCRLNKIILSAAMQSNQLVRTQLHQWMKFTDSLTILSNCDLIIVPYEGEKNQHLLNCLKETDFTNIKKIGVVVGPEGGFSDEEIKLLNTNFKKTKIVKLTSSILRSETASIYTISVLNSILAFNNQNSK